MRTLLRFVGRALRLAPALLWWALGGLVFCVTNFTLKDEIWSNTPAAANFFSALALLCVLYLPWAASHIGWQLADEVESFFWKTIWRLFALAGFAVATVSSILGGLFLLFISWQ